MNKSKSNIFIHSNQYNYLNKRGQIGETMTWVIATIIIILVLAIAIFVTSILGIVGVSKTYKLVGNYDLIPVKSLTSYLLTSDDLGIKVFNQLKEEENLNEFNGNLANKIFNVFYDKDYYFTWLGINLEENIYFGPYSKKVAWETQLNRQCIENFIFLDKDKLAKLFLCG